MVLEKLSAFLDAKIVKRTIPDRDTVASVDGLIVRKKTDWRDVMTRKNIKLFRRTNGKMMRKLGYSLT